MIKKTTVAFLIIASIFVLALKNSASCIHAILHYIPNNPLHQHAEQHKDHINPLGIHKYLEHKRSHNHTHAHDVMDHVHPNEPSQENESPSEEVANTIKFDCYFQTVCNLYTQQRIFNNQLNHFSNYQFCIATMRSYPPFQPPQASFTI